MHTHRSLVLVVIVAAVAMACGGGGAPAVDVALTLDGKDVRFDVAQVAGTVANERVTMTFSEAQGEVGEPQSVVSLELPCAAGPGRHAVDRTNVLVGVQAEISRSEKLGLGTAPGDAGSRTESHDGAVTIAMMACECGRTIVGAMDVTLNGYRGGMVGRDYPLHTIRAVGDFEVSTDLFVYAFGERCR
jgi:hypothetical protein